MIIYLVGSCEKHFVVDRVYTDKDKAIKYCESRANSKYAWAVVSIPTEKDWGASKCIHRVPKCLHKGSNKRFYIPFQTA